jgi:hypothetical protein
MLGAVVGLDEDGTTVGILDGTVVGLDGTSVGVVVGDMVGGIVVGCVTIQRVTSVISYHTVYYIATTCNHKPLSTDTRNPLLSLPQ